MDGMTTENKIAKKPDTIFIMATILLTTNPIAIAPYIIMKVAITCT